MLSGLLPAFAEAPYTLAGLHAAAGLGGGDLALPAAVGGRRSGVAFLGDDLAAVGASERHRARVPRPIEGGIVVGEHVRGLGKDGYFLRAGLVVVAARVRLPGAVVVGLGDAVLVVHGRASCNAVAVGTTLQV